MENNPKGGNDVNDYPMPTLRGHIWRQYGNKIECQSCSTTHYAFLQPNQYISGYEDGIPIISQIVIPLDASTHQEGLESTS